MVHGSVRGHNDDIVCFGAPRNLQQWLERAKKRNDWLWQGNSPYFTLPFSFQINISVKITVVLGCCETCAETSTVIFQSLQHPSLGREGLGYSWKQSMRSNRSRLQQVADNVWVHLYVHFVPFIQVVRVLHKPRLISLAVWTALICFKSVEVNR